MEAGYIGVSDLEWDSSWPGTLRFRVNDSQPAFYKIRVYKNGQLITSYYLGDLSGYVNCFYSENIRCDINESGSYTFKVEISPDDSENITAQVSEVSPAFDYERPAEILATPTGLQWNSQIRGVAEWNSVENASSYSIDLWKDGMFVVGYPNRNDSKVDFRNEIGEYGNYTFCVQAISNDITKYANSEWSYESAPLDFSSTVDQTLEEILQNDNVAAAVDDLKDGNKINQSELLVAMQSNSNVQGMMRELEEKYVDEMNITIAPPVVEDIAIDSGKIDVLGAGLNAGYGQEVVLKISKPDAGSPYNPEVYKNVVQFNMDMLVDGTARKELDIPVTITLPVPDGMNINRLAILHYSSVDGSYETIYPRKNSNGTVSFTINHFSTFAFAETAEEVEQSSVETRDGRNLTNGENSDSEVENELFWKPVTPDEIKRYACKGNEIIDYTLAKENAYPIVIMNAMQGQLCFNSFEAVLGDYTIGRTYNIYPIQNLTYSMDKEVEMTIRIPKAIYQADREYKMICVTKGGQPVILDDLDKVPETITFRTNQFYAFALIYK